MLMCEISWESVKTPGWRANEPPHQYQVFSIGLGQEASRKHRPLFENSDLNTFTFHDQTH